MKTYIRYHRLPGTKVHRLPRIRLSDYTAHQLAYTLVRFDFDFIECFTTTFLRAHSWLNRVDEHDDEHDEVGLKEKPEDTRYIKKNTSK